MKKFLDYTGLSEFLKKLKTIFTEEIKGNYEAPESSEYEDTPSGGFTYLTRDNSGNLTVPHHVTVKNVVTTDGTQTITGDKEFEGTVTVPTPTNGSADGVAANKGYVDSKILENDAMQYKGAVYPDNAPQGGIVLPLTSTNKTTYKVGATFKAAVTTGSIVPGSDPETTYGNYITVSGQTGIKAKAGDLFIVKSITGSSSPYTLTYDYIPAADDVTSIRYSTTVSEVNVGTTAEYGDRVFGEASIKQVDTAITANSESANLPTTDAVTDYVDSRSANNLTATTGTTGTVDVKLKNGLGTATDLATINISTDSATTVTASNNNIAIGAVVVDANGLKKDSTNGIQLDIQNGLNEVTESGVKKLAVKAYDGITVDNNGVSVDLSTTGGLELKGDTPGAKSVGIKIDDVTETGNAHGLSIGTNGLHLALATQSTDGAMSAADKLKLDNLGTNYADKLDVETGTTTGTVDLKLKNSNAGTLDTVTIASANKAVAVAASGTAGTSDATTLTVTANVDEATGLEITNNGIAINNGDGIEFADNKVKAKVKANNGLKNGSTNGIELAIGNGLKEDTNNTLEVKNGNGITVDSTGVVAVGDNARAVSVNASGIGTDITTHNGLKYDSNTIKLDIDTDAGLKETDSGNKLAINSGNGLDFSSGAIVVKAATNSGVVVDANGVSLTTITTSEVDALFA